MLFKEDTITFERWTSFTPYVRKELSFRQHRSFVNINFTVNIIN